MYMSRCRVVTITQVFFFVNSGVQLYCKTVVLSVALCVFLFSVCFRCLRFTFYVLLFAVCTHRVPGGTLFIF